MRSEAQFAFSKKQKNKKLFNTGLAFMHCGGKIILSSGSNRHTSVVQAGRL
jgi:hypothetical protein